MSDSIKQKTKNGLLWSMAERFSVQGVQFLIMIFMARLLTPSDYGIIGMLAIFIALSQAMVDSGFSQALIRKQDRTEVDNSTVFYFNIVVGIFLYALLYLGAPWVADFYNQEILTPILRVLGVVVIVNSLTVVQRAQLTAKVDFKTQAKASLIAAVISGVIGIYLAYSGYGVWALAYQQILNVAINAIALWIFSSWRPIASFSWISFRELFGFGSKLMLVSLIDTAYKNIYGIVIGKCFSASILGNYTRASHFAEFPSSNITSVISRVTYPVLCQIQDDDDRLRNVYRRFIKLFAYVVFPLMTGLAAVSHPFISVMIGPQWSFCAVLLGIICFQMMWYPVHSINLNLLQVKGRSDLFLRLEILKKIVLTVSLFISVPLGVIAMCYVSILTSIINLALNTYYTGKIIQVGFKMQILDLFPTLILSLSMYVAVLLVTSQISNAFIQLIVGCLFGCIFYLAGSKLFKFTELDEIANLLKLNKH